VFSAREQEVLISGPAGTGKSRAALEKLMLVAMLNPGMRGLMVRKTLASLGSTALETWRKFVIPELLAAGECWWYGGSSAEPAQYKFRNGSSIVVGGMDKAMKIMSSEYDLIYVQEATELRIGDWEALLTRLRNGAMSFQQLLADCNPDTPTHWLKQRCDTGTTRMLYSLHVDNPILFDNAGIPTDRGAKYLETLDALTGVRRLRLRDGLWVAAEGIIYPEFDPATHLVDRFDIPQDWDRYWAIDFGFTNPFVLQCWAEDPDGRLFRYREIYHTRRTVAAHARQILSIVAPGGEWIEPEPVAIITDHDAESRENFEQHIGCATLPARKAVKEGIDLVKDRFTSNRLFFLRDSLVERDLDLVEAKQPTCTEEELPGYVWKPNKDEPLKERDHGGDTTRYMVAERDMGSRPQLRSLT
jgi:phage terminase large subunit